MDKTYGIIYKATNKINDKAYIGQTIKSLEIRKSQHISRALRERSDFYFYRAIRKYGVENFSWKIIDRCDNIKFLDDMEIFYIGYYNTFVDGYNLTFGGKNGCQCLAETKKRLSVANKGKRSWLGKKHTEESKLKMSISRMGKKNHFYGKYHSEETKRKMSEAQSGEKHHLYGKHLSFETKQKLSKANSGKNSPLFGTHLSDETKRKISVGRVGKYMGKNSVCAVAITIGDKYFDTRIEAAEFIGVTPAAIRKRILHKTKWLDYHYAN